ncbi:hypothetical protein GCM10011504_07990 [Siccirubricoccus deserti]|uniref:Uncharacterized protein n=1 Tax=Siccirubricoccus deserti TaxID=2013562 RepID=A0A9X0QVA9_9PROT|nr:hypothetical protein [Siccirubricoccus deserti]MBC4014525.1 hypothetical protein [Siccirubricoccus deserti]GGC32201.1 hypothetical protein GCM10011504_07990 [Siccirubricoccus deserti]
MSRSSDPDAEAGCNAKGRDALNRRATGSGLGAALFGAAMLLLAGAAGAGAATHFTPATPQLFGVLGLLLGCPEIAGAAPIPLFDADDLAMLEDVAEPPP